MILLKIKDYVFHRYISCEKIPINLKVLLGLCQNMMYCASP